MWDGHDGMGWWMLWGSILWTALIIAIVFVAAKYSSTGTQDGRSSGYPSQPPSETPLDILRRRYASGELSREEFEQMRRDLGGG